MAMTAFVDDMKVWNHKLTKMEFQSQTISDEEDYQGHDSDEAYEREQLEIALYSKVHFEENTDTVNDVLGDDSDKGFTIDVHCDDWTGFVATDKTSDFILNQAIGNKYGVLPHKEDDVYRLKHKAVINKDTTSKLQTRDKCQEKKVSTKPRIKTNVDHKGDGKSKDTLAEQLILGQSSDIDQEKLSFSDNESESMFESEDDQIYGVLGKKEKSEMDLKLNVESWNSEKEVEKEDTPKEYEMRTDSSLRKTSSKGRYYKPIECYNCKQNGHLSKNCLQPKKLKVCILCSEPGHISWNCPEMFCFNCYAPGHESKHCREPRRNYLNAVCHRCNMYGHEQSKCPDIWRQYHLTTRPGELIKPRAAEKKKGPIYCYNCADEGHFGHECEEERMTKFVRVHTPFICRYQPVKEFQKMEKRREEDSSDERSSKRQKSSHSREYSGKMGTDTLVDRESNAVLGRSEDAKDNSSKRKERERKINFPLKNKWEDSTGKNNFDKLQSVIKNGASLAKNSKTQKNKRKHKTKKGLNETVVMEARKETKLSMKKSKISTGAGNKRDQNMKKIQENEDFPRGGVVDMSVTFSHKNSVRAVDLGHRNGCVDGFLGELFSLGRRKGADSGKVSGTMENLDLDHQAYNNEWWGKKKKRRRRTRKQMKGRN